MKYLIKPFSFEQFLWIFEHDEIFPIDETVFYFDNDLTEEHYLGCLRNSDKPYWVGYCDIPNGSEFTTACEMLNAKIYDGFSIKDRWDNITFTDIGGISIGEWLKMYQCKF